MSSVPSSGCDYRAFTLQRVLQGQGPLAHTLGTLCPTTLCPTLCAPHLDPCSYPGVWGRHCGPLDHGCGKVGRRPEGLTGWAAIPASSPPLVP